MRVEVRQSARNDPVRLYVQQRVVSCLGHWERIIEGVTVCVSTLPEPRQHRCRMLVRLLPWANLAVQEADRDLYAAVDRAADRLARAIEAAMGRRPRHRARRHCCGSRAGEAARLSGRPRPGVCTEVKARVA